MYEKRGKNSVVSKPGEQELKDDDEFYGKDGEVLCEKINVLSW